jgi:predicted dehydrogenase
MREIKFALLGFGGIAQSHKYGYDILMKEGFPIKLVAICDIDEKQFHAKQEINLGASVRSDLDGINLYTSVDEMLACEDFEVVDICLPSYMHKEYAIKLMRAGKHVQSEKPMALSYDDCKEMLAVADECGKKLMIGQCLHFEAGYEYLKKCIDEGTFGKLRSLSFERLGGLPGWGFEGWYRDLNRSGGCPFDLHIHDVDMANYLLGMPKSVSSVAQDAEMPIQYVNTRMFYDNGVIAYATASWNESSTSGFRMAYRARFDAASLIYNGGSVKVCPDDGSEPYEAEGTRSGERKDRMAEEIRATALAVGDPDFVNTVNDPRCAAGSIYLTEKIIESARKNGETVVL